MFIKLKSKIVFITILLSFFVSVVSADFIYNEGIINKKTQIKLEEIATELKQKTGISLYLQAVKNMNGASISEYSKDLRIKFEKEPYIVLIFAQDEKKVDIISSKQESQTFDKEEVLDPFNGTIIPILVTKVKKDVKVDDKYSAALLNGFADIADQVASYYDVKLDSGIGSTNRNIVNSLRIVFYVILALAIAFLIRRRFAK